jgi:Meiotically up-regulated gene 113
VAASVFLDWLRYQVTREDCVGQLTRYLFTTNEAKDFRTHSSVRFYLESVPNNQAWMGAFQQATMEFDTERDTLVEPQETIALICAQCRKPLRKDEYDMLNFAWPYQKGIKGGGPYFLLHKLCTHSYEIRHAMIGIVELPDIFNPKQNDAKSFLRAPLLRCLNDFFQPRHEPVRLKFGKDVWVGNANHLTLLPKEEAKKQEKSRKSLLKTSKPPVAKEAKPKPRKSGKPGYVYLIEAVGSERIKIGHGESAHKRLRQLGTGAPFPLRLLHSIPATDSLAFEQELHARYEVYKVWKEWYILPPDVLAALLKEEAP